MPFVYSRPVHLYETDLMGVVHHSNYIRYMEEARFQWLRDQELMHLHGPERNCVFAVLELSANYKSPLKWGDHFEVNIRVVQMRSRFRFESSILALRGGHKEDRELVSQGVVVLACVNNKMQPIKPPMELIKFFNREVEHGS